jgi:hypothetical protein
MPTTEKLPKWVSLLLTLLIGAAFTFGGQLFIAMAAKGQKQGANAPKSCTLADGAVQAGKTTTLALGKLGQSNDDQAIQKIDVTKFHLDCGGNKKGGKAKKPNPAAAY